MGDFTKSVKLHTRKTIENRLLSRIDNAPISICCGAKMVSFYYCHLDLKENVMVLASLHENLNDSKLKTFVLMNAKNM
jgi:hypothetical protein